MLFKWGLWFYQRILGIFVWTLQLLDRWNALRYLPFLAEHRGRFQPLPPGAKVWCHCASLGESKHLARFLNEVQWWKTRKILVTFQTRSAADFWRTLHGELLREGNYQLDIRYFPLDCQKLMKPLAGSLQHAVVFESELWPGWIQWCVRHQVKFHWLSVRMGAQTQKLFEQCVKRWPSAFDSLQPASLVEEECFKKLFSSGKRCGPRASLKIEALEMSLMDLPSEVPQRVGVISFHQEELENVLGLLLNYPEKEFVLVPRHLKELPRIKEALGQRKIHFAPWQFQKNSKINQRILLVEEMGKVSQVLKEVELAVVGGSFAALGVHNIFEPLSLGRMVWVGRYVYPLAKEIEVCENLKVLKVIEEWPADMELPKKEEWEAFERWQEDLLKQRQIAIRWIDERIRKRA